MNILKHILIIITSIFIFTIPIISFINYSTSDCSISNFWCIGDFLYTYLLTSVLMIRLVYPFLIIILFSITYNYLFKKYFHRKNRIIVSIFYALILLVLGFSITVFLLKENEFKNLTIALIFIPTPLIIGFIMDKIMFLSYKEYFEDLSRENYN